VRQQLARSHSKTGDREVVAVTVEIVKVEVGYVLLFGTAVQTSPDFDVALLHAIMFSLTDILKSFARKCCFFLGGLVQLPLAAFA